MLESEFAGALVKALAEMPEIVKTRTAKVETKTGGSYSYAYADLTSILTAVKPTLLRHGLAVSQSVTRTDRLVEVTTHVIHTSGGMLSCGPLGFDPGQTPQSAGSAISYARRYGLLAALGLGTEDDDGHAARPDPVAALWSRVLQVEKGSDRAERLKQAAVDAGVKLSEQAVAETPGLYSTIADILNQ